MSEHAKKLREWPTLEYPTTSTPSDTSGQTLPTILKSTVSVLDEIKYRMDCNAAADYIDRLEAEKAELVGACNKAWPMLFRLSYYEGCINQPSLALANELSDILAKHKEKT